MGCQFYGPPRSAYLITRGALPQAWRHVSSGRGFIVVNAHPLAIN